jgi:hypothetical protein
MMSFIDIFRKRYIMLHLLWTVRGRLYKCKKCQRDRKERFLWLHNKNSKRYNIKIFSLNFNRLNLFLINTMWIIFHRNPSIQIFLELKIIIMIVILKAVREHQKLNHQRKDLIRLISMRQ